MQQNMISCAPLADARVSATKRSSWAGKSDAETSNSEDLSTSKLPQLNGLARERAASSDEETHDSCSTPSARSEDSDGETISSVPSGDLSPCSPKEMNVKATPFEPGRVALRSSAPLFVPGSAVMGLPPGLHEPAASAVGLPPGLRKPLRSKAAAFVPATHLYLDVGLAAWP